MGSLLHLDVRYRLAVRGVLLEPEPVPAGTRQHPERCRRRGHRYRFAGRRLVHLRLPVRLAAGQAPCPARRRAVRPDHCCLLRLQPGVQRPWCVPAHRRDHRHHHGRQRVPHHHAGTAPAGSGDREQPDTGPGTAGQGPAALASQQLLHPAGAVHHDQQPLPEHLR